MYLHQPIYSTGALHAHQCVTMSLEFLTSIILGPVQSYSVRFYFPGEKSYAYTVSFLFQDFKFIKYFFLKTC